jgi:hypothetical protein
MVAAAQSAGSTMSTDARRSTSRHAIAQMPIDSPAGHARTAAVRRQAKGGGMSDDWEPLWRWYEQSIKGRRTDKNGLEHSRGPASRHG